MAYTDSFGNTLSGNNPSSDIKMLSNDNAATLGQGIYAVPATGATINPVWSGGSPGQGILYTPTPTSTAISVDQLQNASPITLPTQTPTANPLDATSAGAQATSKSLQDYIKELTPPETQTSKDYNSLTSSLESLLPGLTGRGAEQVTAEQNAGLPDLKVKLANINAQILSKVAEANKTNASYEQLIANLENPNNAQQQGIPQAAIIGQQAQARKLQLAENNSKSADLMLLQAVASGMQGNITAMQSNIDRAIDLKFSDRQAEVDLKMQQLSLLEGKLNKEEQITKLALERKYQDEQTKIQEEKAKAKDNINLAFSSNVQTKYANKGGEWFRVSDGKSFSTPEELFKDAGIKSFDEAYKKGLVTDLNASRVADVEFVQQLRAKYPDAGITINDSATTASQKLNNSRIYREEVRGPVGSTTGTLGGTTIVDTNVDADVKNIINSHIKTGYGSAFDAVKAKYGDAVAQRYDKVYQDVFNKGISVDAAYNNLKLGGTSGGLVDASGKPVKLSSAQQGNVADWDTLSSLASQANTLGEQLGWSGTGGFGQGTVSQFLAKQGIAGTQEEEQLRNIISNIKGTLAKARGGTSFTPNEQKLLDSYTPGINDSPTVLKAKLASLQSFITTTKQNIYSAAGAVNSTNNDPLGVR